MCTFSVDNYYHAKANQMELSSNWSWAGVGVGIGVTVGIMVGGTLMGLNYCGGELELNLELGRTECCFYSPVRMCTLNIVDKASTFVRSSLGYVFLINFVLTTIVVLEKITFENCLIFFLHISAIMLKLCNFCWKRKVSSKGENRAQGHKHTHTF